MIVHHLAAHHAHQAVETLCRGTLKPRVGLAFAPYTIHHIGAVQPQLHHLRYGLHIVLQVGVNAYGSIAVCRGPFKARPQCLLVSHVVGQTQAAHVLVGLSQFFYDLPSAVGTPIVDVHDAPVVYQRLGLHASYHIGEPRIGFVQHSFFVVTGYYYRKGHI